VPDVIRRRYGAPVTTGSTLTFPYPAGRSSNDYRQDGGAYFFPRSLQNRYTQNVDFTLAFGEGQVTLTWNNPITIPFDLNTVDSNNSGARWEVALELPLYIDAATQLWPPADGGDTYVFT